MKVALITGGSSGIGEATAIEFAKLGYQVAITGRAQDRLQKVIDRLVENSPSKLRENFLSMNAEFENPAEVEPIVGRVVEAFDRLDVVINNAGYPGERRTFDDPNFYSDFVNIMQVNLMAATRIAQLAMPHLVKTTGVLINISSIADNLAIPNGSYSISKAGMSMMTKTLANALDGTGVRVLTVSPGPVETNFSRASIAGPFKPTFAMSRCAKSKEIADTIVFLCSDKASFIHGCTINVDGGWSAKANGFTKRE